VKAPTEHRLACWQQQEERRAAHWGSARSLV